MRKNLLIAAFLWLVAYSVQAQQVRFGLQTGVSKYALKDLKNLNQSVQNSVPFRTHIVSDYPAFVYFQPSVVMENGNWNYGLFYNFYSTGSRISASDYSADYLVDTRINANTIGLTGEYYFYQTGIFKIGAYTNLGLSLTHYKLKESLIAADSTLFDIPYQKYRSYNVLGEPGILISIPWQSLQLTFNAGYSFQLFGSGLKKDETTYWNLINPHTGKEAKAQWNGYKLGIGISYSFPYKAIVRGSGAF